VTYAIFKAAGFQYRAQLGDVLRLPVMDVESGATVTFDEVLLGASDEEVLIGRPTLEGAAVRAQVLRHGRADKIVVFKFKRRKGYARKQGHRQGFTEVRIDKVSLG
jgi:large subunit ribosomal protein L21